MHPSHRLDWRHQADASFELLISTSPCSRQESLTDIVNGLAESWVLTDGDDQALDGSDDRWEREDTSGLVLLTSPVAVLEKRIEDSAKTE
jgi:hypothetical protein